ncbi:MAG: NAD(P)(+) transhydrogenase (Re/Si-specific) subunit alpha, partial [Phycisphaerae bacterium]
MKLAVPKEIVSGETRVALVPSCVAKLVKAGMEVSVESGAGKAAGCDDADYQAKEATIEPDQANLFAEADAVAMVHPPDRKDETADHQIDQMKQGAL